MGCIDRILNSPGFTWSRISKEQKVGEELPLIIFSWLAHTHTQTHTIYSIALAWWSLHTATIPGSQFLHFSPSGIELITTLRCVIISCWFQNSVFTFRRGAYHDKYDLCESKKIVNCPESLIYSSSLFWSSSLPTSDTCVYTQIVPRSQ